MIRFLIIVLLFPLSALALNPVADTFTAGNLEDCGGKKSTNCYQNRKLVTATCSQPTQRVDDSSISGSDIAGYNVRVWSSSMILNRYIAGSVCETSFYLVPGTYSYQVKVNAVAGATQDSAYTTSGTFEVYDQPAMQGFGTSSTFGAGAGFETCDVTNLNDSGAGSFRDCIENRNGANNNPTPRTITFSVGGTITLASDLTIRQPYLTIDGLSAPTPGITIAKTSDTAGATHIGTWVAESTCGHDVLVQGLRFTGVWDEVSEATNQNADVLGIDGEDLVNCLNNIVIWRNSFAYAQDTGAGLWGSVKNLTFAYNMIYNSLHPQQISHWPGGATDQERQYLSIHHNIYAYTHERTPNFRGNVWDVSLIQNVFHKWDAFGFPGGYSTSFRCRGTGCPLRINMTNNHWTSGGTLLDYALIFADGADPAQVYSANNRLPTEETEDGTAASAFSLSDNISVLTPNEFATQSFSYIGHPYPIAEETAIKNEVRSQMQSEF